jgi:hypothetical protein
VYAIVDGLPLDPFDISLYDSCESEISLNTSCIELPGDSQGDENKDSGSVHVPSTDYDSKYENPS